MNNVEAILLNNVKFKPSPIGKHVSNKNSNVRLYSMTVGYNNSFDITQTNAYNGQTSLLLSDVTRYCDVPLFVTEYQDEDYYGFFQGGGEDYTSFYLVKAKDVKLSE